MKNDRPEETAPGATAIPEKLPLGQVLMDDIFFLLALGFGIPSVLYTLWAVIEVLRVPPA